MTLPQASATIRAILLKTMTKNPHKETNITRFTGFDCLDHPLILVRIGLSIALFDDDDLTAWSYNFPDKLQADKAWLALNEELGDLEINNADISEANLSRCCWKIIDGGRVHFYWDDEEVDSGKQYNRWSLE